MSNHDRARELAQDISEGINSMANLRKLAKAGAQPSPECVADLDDMERAFQGVRDGGVDADFVADDALMADIRGVRGLVADWLSTNTSPPDLVPMIEGLLARIGITVEFLDSSS